MKKMMITQPAKIKYTFILTFLFLSGMLLAKENVPGTGGSNGDNSSGAHHRGADNNSVMVSDCDPGKLQVEIKLNNVRTRILTDGDMWWDPYSSVAKYEVPKGSNSYAMFAGSIWIGGYTGTTLKVAAMTYRQTGIDFWPGPIDPVQLTTDNGTCKAWDKVFSFNRADVDNFSNYYTQYHTADPNTPQWIKDYPGNALYPAALVKDRKPFNPPLGNPIDSLDPFYTRQLYYLAPFEDVDNDQVYNYANGDYPRYNVANVQVNRGQCVRYLFGDQTLFWVFNDRGNKHTETQGNPIGLEIRAQAFEFATSDELNDMSFYNYEIINWSSTKLDSTYMTVWADCDLGNYLDDYVGCDVGRGLGYQYNGDNYDDDANGQTGYHDKLPSIGVDFFQGPYADTNDNIDNDRDGCVDCSWALRSDGSLDVGGQRISDKLLPEQCIMSRFTYYNNDGDPKSGNPGTNGGGIQYYNFMNGRWKDGTSMTYGGSGKTAGNPSCNFLYPGTTDPDHPVEWTEILAGNQPGDRRFMQSAGKFTLLPGAVNYVTFGLPFARSNSQSNTAPIPLMLAADDKAQSLFDNCFKVLNGPDAPDLTIQELNQQLLITLTNKPSSNNYEAKRYAEKDPSIKTPYILSPDQTYRFEGYIVYQLKDGSVGTSDLNNTNLARPVFQCDIKNGVSNLINYNFDKNIGQLVPSLMVTGSDAGIKNSFSLSEDQFASGDKHMINFKTYYYTAVAYAYNNYLTYLQDVPPTASTNTAGVVVYNDPKSGDENGQKKPFLQGRRNIKNYSGIPHNPTPEAYGSIMSSSYGTGPQITRIEGQGNGGHAMELTAQSINDILSSPISRSQLITYEGNAGPFEVKVTDPLTVVKGDFTLRFVSAQKVKVNTDSLWEYLGNPPSPNAATLDSGKVKNTDAMRWVVNGTYTDASGNTVTRSWLSDEGLKVAQEKILTGPSNELLGLSVTVKQVADPNYTARADASNAGKVKVNSIAQASDVISANAVPAVSWLSGVTDVDGSPTQDWILSGGNKLTSPNDIKGTVSVNGKLLQIEGDPDQVYENILGGTWAPFRFANYNLNYPGFNPLTTIAKPIIVNASQGGYGNGWGDTRLLSSVNIVFTNDPSKWSRCPVIDMNPNTNSDPNTNLPLTWQLRRAPSVDKNGNTTSGPDNNDFDSSMSWFPGYAIDIETGERLNILFAENSGDPTNNGADMLWNPTSKIKDATGKVVNGGMHYIYVCGHNADGNFTIGSNVVPSDVRRYDAGQSIYQMLKLNTLNYPVDYNALTNSQKSNKWSVLAELFKDIMWTSMPLSSVDIKDPHSIPNDVTIKIRVPKPFRYGLSTVTSPANTSFSVAATGNLSSLGTYSLTPLSSNSVTAVPSDVVTAPQNGNFPMYKFSTGDLAPKTYQEGTADAALAMITIVPNPYYAHSSYEATRIDLMVKIINLPVKCKIRIYTLSGVLIRTLDKDNSDTYLNWDLHNDKNIQIASGLYIIHIDAPGIGEKVIKWFGVLRPYDLQSY